MFKSLFFVVCLGLSSIAVADCTYDGVVYPEGTVMGPYVCSGNEWVNR
jgi:hypothetical protein